jgi:hypothetical protein
VAAGSQGKLLPEGETRVRSEKGVRLAFAERPIEAAICRRLPEDVEADAALVGALLDVPEADAARLLDELEEAGCVASATGPLP